MKLYEKLFEAWRREASTVEVQPLPRDFYRRLTTFIRGLREEAKLADRSSLQGRLILKLVDRTVKLTESLCFTRLVKILGCLAKERLDWDRLTDEEKTIFSGAERIITEFNRMVGCVVEGRPLQIEKRREVESKLKLVRLLTDTPSFIGVDLRVYGPFKREDIASIPEENANILVEQGVASKLEVTD